MDIKEVNILLNKIEDAVIVVDDEERIVLANHALERMMDINTLELIGKMISTIKNNYLLHQLLRRNKAKGNIKKKIGDRMIISSYSPILGYNDSIKGFIYILKDVTETEKLANKLLEFQQKNTLLESIINSIQDAISVVDEKGLFIMINQAYTNILGTKKEDVLLKPIKENLPKGEESIHNKVLKSRRPIHGIRKEIGINKRFVSVDAAPVMVEGNFKGSVAIIHDFTKVMELAQELENVRKIILDSKSTQAKYSFENIICNSSDLNNAINSAKCVASTPVTVLLRGESGTGKELFAHSIHNESNRREKRFIRVNCATLAESLLESILFGYVGGAFTGAKKDGQIGIFEEANGGTIFLDEIGEISLQLQAKLLRVLQEKEIVRVGDTKSIPVDARVIAATNANLEELIENKLFREDLYYRLNVFPIYIPPLRDRKEDISLLINYILQKYNLEYSRHVGSISQEAIGALRDYHWPGNIRELENVISRSLIQMSPEEIILQKDHLCFLSRTQVSKSLTSQTKSDYYNKNYNEAFKLWEKEFLSNVFTNMGYNKTKTAQALDISVRSLYDKLKKYEIK